MLQSKTRPCPPMRDKGANPCGTTPVPRKRGTRACCNGHPRRSLLSAQNAHSSVRGSQVIFAVDTPPPSHHAGGSLRRSRPVTRPVQSLMDIAFLYYRRGADLSTVFLGNFSGKLHKISGISSRFIASALRSCHAAHPPRRPLSPCDCARRLPALAGRQAVHSAPGLSRPAPGCSALRRRATRPAPDA